MFVYQDKAGNICVTFADNKPVEAPEYVIAVDKEAKSLYMVSGTIEARPDDVEDDTADNGQDAVEETVEPEVTDETEEEAE